SPLEAISGETLLIERLSKPILFDGIINDSAWERIIPLPLTMYTPKYEGDLTEFTEIRVAHDDNFIYIGGSFFDSSPLEIRSNSLERDRLGGDDTFEFILDTFNDNENALSFIINPAGTRLDLAISNDAEFSGGEPFNKSWNTYWEVETFRDDKGWYAEIKIPFSSLRFQEVDGKIKMGMIVSRYIARKNERQLFPGIDPKYGFNKPSLAQDIMFTVVKSSLPVYITPYILGDRDSHIELNDAETQYNSFHDASRELGLDVKFSPSSNFTIDLTLNTDFAQAEVDDEQINLSRFSLFFPEKRLFFQDRASVFNINTGEESNLFYSRRIGINDDGPVRIYGGARVVGKLDKWDMGLINMQTASTSITPAENLGVVRLRKKVLNEHSYAGGMITSRLGNDGSYNIAYGLDGDINFTGNNYFAFSLSQSIEDSIVDNNLLSPLNSMKAQISLMKRVNTGPGYNLSLSRSGENYNPGLGFDPRVGATIASHWLRYDFRPENSERLQQIRIFIGGQTVFRNSDENLETISLGPGIFVQTRSGRTFFARVFHNFESLSESFELDDDVEVLPGNYSFNTFSSSLSTPAGSLFRTDLSLGGGGFYDGTRFTFKISPTWSVSSHLELGGEYLLNRINFKDRNQKFNADLIKVRARYSLNNNLSTNTFIQYNTNTDKFHLNFRLRYNFRDGTDFYLVYNEGRNTNRFRETLIIPTIDDRTVILKYSYTFQPTL
ncbi:MAG: hypothetical protein IIB41_06400, partial [Candidatus Marinimicrobia bacterium]|nr:hypothetical protein [Candidatus Neomarinimicrobiota bacterium]